MIITDKIKTCSVTGHRQVDNSLNREKIRETFKVLIYKGINVFLIGMAIGFDSICFKILLELKEEFGHIKIVAVIPCNGQDKNFSTKDKENYAYFLSRADETIILNDKYCTGCMLERNRYLVDNSDIIVAYQRKNSGGSAYTTNYATMKNKPIIYL